MDELLWSKNIQHFESDKKLKYTSNICMSIEYSPNFLTASASFFQVELSNELIHDGMSQSVKNLNLVERNESIHHFGGLKILNLTQLKTDCELNRLTRRQKKIIKNFKVILSLF